MVGLTDVLPIGSAVASTAAESVPPVIRPSAVASPERRTSMIDGTTATVVPSGMPVSRTASGSATWNVRSIGVTSTVTSASRGSPKPIRAVNGSASATVWLNVAVVPVTSTSKVVTSLMASSGPELPVMLTSGGSTATLLTTKPAAGMPLSFGTIGTRLMPTLERIGTSKLPLAGSMVTPATTCPSLSRASIGRDES